MQDCNYAFSGFKPCRGNYSYFHKKCPEHLPNYGFLQKKGVQMGVQMRVQIGGPKVGSTFCTDPAQWQNCECQGASNERS